MERSKNYYNKIKRDNMKTLTHEARLELLAKAKNQTKQEKANSFRGVHVVAAKTRVNSAVFN